MLKRLSRNEKGLTLIELLAVIVILGIIAAIAVPSIGNIIENSKKDAHIANAEQLVSAARLAMASDMEGNNGDLPGTTTNPAHAAYFDYGYSLGYLVEEGYLESLPEIPGAEGSYSEDKSTRVVIRLDDNRNPNYYVKLIRKEGTEHFAYIGGADNNNLKDEINSGTKNTGLINIEALRSDKRRDYVDLKPIGK
ncbi:type II secretion system protein [Bacillus tianshenii]|nr:type II secretion system protein [Bacillus tianshenii]